MSIFFRKIFCFLLVLSCFQMGFSQIEKQKRLEQKREKIQKEINKINRLLFSTKKKEKNLLQQIENLNIKINKRLQLIRAVDAEIKFLTKKIAKNIAKNDSLKKALSSLKKEYAKMVFKSYKNHIKQTKLLFLLSADSFNQAYKRLGYMKQYASFREKQALEIQQKTQRILQINNRLHLQKNKKKQLITIYKRQENKIADERIKKKKTILKIKAQERNYIAQIKQKQREERKLDAEIERLIRLAILDSKKKNKSSGFGFRLTPQAKALASKFEKNKGKLPWPVKNALIVRRFGRIPHETLKGIILQSNGIQVATKSNSQALAIFEGRVLAVQVSKNGIKTVMIQHGNYISVYGNLEKINVKKGDKIGLKTQIGKIYTNKINDKTILKFQIWKNTQKQNPEQWLLRLN